MTAQPVKNTNKTAISIEWLLSYRPPYRWDLMQSFLAKRLIPGLEWINDDAYGRTFRWRDGNDKDLQGYFTATHLADKNAFRFELTIDESADESTNLIGLENNIRRLFVLDTDIRSVEQHLAQLPGLAPRLTNGLRLPGIWCSFEAGIRAILGQQISVEAARKLVLQVVESYGDRLADKRLFPTPEQLAAVDFAVLRIPQSRKNTLMAFSRFCAQSPQHDDLDCWLDIKGIGPWTVNYAKMRGQNDSDIWLGSDLGVIKALAKVAQQAGSDEITDFNVDDAKPWRSYLTFQCWHWLA